MRSLLDDLPRGAIEIVNLEDTHAKMWEGFTNARHDGQNHPFLEMLRQAEAKGKFRPLVEMDDIGWESPVFDIARTPRFDIHDLLEEEYWLHTIRRTSRPFIQAYTPRAKRTSSSSDWPRLGP